jgi:DNA repair exonuclease SbcCD nuclease subunit
MRIICITDTHYGARQDNPHFYTYQKKFYDNILFPYIENHDIDGFIHLGDLVENRKTMHYSTLSHLKNNFLEPLSNFFDGETSVFIAGNHDSHVHTNLSINAMREFVDFGFVVDKPETIFNGKILCIPWICKENREECEQAIHESQAEYCFGHFELKGFKDNNGLLSRYGDDSNYLSGFKKVFSGHFHERSRQGNVTYIGAPFQYIWSDFDNYRGFCIFDTNTGEIKFVKNPYSIFSTIEYTNESVFNPESMKRVKDTYCRIFKKNGQGTTVDFNDFVKKVLDLGVIDLQVVEECDRKIIDDVPEAQNVSGDLKEVMFRYIDNQAYNDPELIKDRFSQLYGRALKW